MKFGEQLRSSVIPEYQWYYIAYNDLKEQLHTAYITRPSRDNPKPRRRQWTEQDEQRFIDTLDRELDKVDTKQKLKGGEIQRRIGRAEKDVNELLEQLEAARRHQRPMEDNGGTMEEAFIELEDILSDIIADVHDLAKFVQLNYTGFQKITKKHDKTTKWMLRPLLETWLKRRSFFKDNYDATIVKLSVLYNIVETRGNPVKGDSSAGGSQASFIRQTTKYFVHPDNVTEVKLIILKHLPVLVFNPSKEFETKDSAITSIYYDSPERWHLYEGRLKKTEGAEAIRLRWYGGMDTEQIFVERKTHREDWTGEKSVKARFGMKEKNVNAFLNGNLLPRTFFDKARQDGRKDAKAIDEDERLAKEIQYTVLRDKLAPVCRSFYNRTAFQLPADARVRISLDTELTMVREDNLDGKRRSDNNWRRMDIGIDFPFSQLPPDDIERFPYAILEVKLQTQVGQEPPEWVCRLISSHLVEAVPKFSKFIHGTATLFPTRIHLLPYWMPQMNVDIRKPVTEHFGIRRPGIAASGSTSDDDDEEDSDEEDNEESETNTTVGQSRPSSRDQPESANPHDIEGQVSILSVPQEHYDSDSETEVGHEPGEEARRIGRSSDISSLMRIMIRQLGHYASTALRSLNLNLRPTQIPTNTFPEQTTHGGAEIEIVNRRFKAPPGKKIHVPVRVEPKVYFAAERTFLSWLEFSVYLSLIAITLLNFPSKHVSSPGIANKTSHRKNHHTPRSFLAAGTFSLLAFSALLYSAIVYYKRSSALRFRRAVRYHDKWGVTVLCLAVMAGVCINAFAEGRGRCLF